MANVPLFGCRDQAALTRVPEMVMNSPAEVRVGMARQMGGVLDVELSETERTAAEEIVRVLCDDIVNSVRKALAAAVASSPHLPSQFARRLALDIEEVSIPVLEVCGVLSDGALLEVIRKATPRQLEATARRPIVSEVVSDAIVERGHVPAISMLVANRGAEVGAETWLNVIERHGQEAQVVRAASERGRIPEEVAAKLATMAMAHVRTFVVRYLNVPSSIIPTLDNLQIEVDAARHITPVVPPGKEPSAHAMKLVREGRLGHRELFQALCAGEFGFVVAALGHLSNLSFTEVQQRLFSSSSYDREDLLERAGVEPRMAAAFERLLDMGAISDIDEYQRNALKTLSAVAGRDVAFAGAA